MLIGMLGQMPWSIRLVDLSSTADFVVISNFNNDFKPKKYTIA